MVTTSKTASTTATTLVAEVAGPAIELVGGVLEEEQGGQVAGMCVKGQLGQLVGLVVGSVGIVKSGAMSLRMLTVRTTSCVSRCINDL